MNGMYISPERVVRDGRLVAFEGEAMTMAEAVARGLVSEKAEKPAVDGSTRAELVSFAEGLGIDVPAKATKAEIAQLIEEAEK